MAFTYALSSSDANDVLVSRVRLELGDTVNGTGVRPNGANLTDEEIAIWLTDEDNDPMRATARACEALSRMWTIIASYSSGSRSEQLGKVAEEWAKKGEKMRAQYGGSSGSAFSIELGRSDGYADVSEEAE